MKQDVFNNLTSETEFMRYIHRLCDKDYSLVHGMVPLGSCTMKLNSAAVMTPITFPGFCEIHPFAPKD
jgi:glycine dehydrogenase